MNNIARSLALLVVFAGMDAAAQVVTYCCDATAEQQYLADIAGLGTYITESFETAPWDQVRRPFSLASITSQGIIWSQPNGGITTSNPRAHDGAWQVYAVGPDGIRHPVPDGFDVQGDGITFNAFGGWYFGGNTKIRFTVDGNPNRVNFSGTEATIPQNWTFLGFIDTTPFTTVEISETDETGDETRTFWADDFTFSMSGAAASPGQLQFGNAAYSVAENGTQVQVTVTRTGGGDGAVSVDYATSDGSANAGSDYTATSGTLNFLDGQVNETIDIPIIDDIVYEGDETFAINLTNVTGGATLGTPGSSTITIQEDETPPAAGSLQFDSASSSLAENGGSFTLTVTRSGGSFGSVTIDYVTGDNTATAGSDYTSTSGTLTFADGVMSQNFNVSVLDDSDYEGDEVFFVSLSNPGGGASLGTPSTSTLTISDNDPVPPAGSLQFSADTYTVDESGPALVATVTRTGGSFGAVTVDYVSSDGTATAGTDYSATSGTLSFADGDLNKTFNVPIVDDATYEGDETFGLDLSNVTGGAFSGAPMSATVTITENDPVPQAGSLQFSGTSYSVGEGGIQAVVTVTRTGGTSGQVTLDYATVDGSATAGSDYAATSATLIFDDGDTSKTFSVSITDDSTYEGDESFTVSLSNATGGASLGTPGVATVTVVENDAPPAAGSLQFSGANYSVAENSTSVLITVVRTGGSAGTVGVNYVTSDATATAGSDYTATAGDLTFGEGITSRSFSVTILDDLAYEGSESFGLTLSGASGGAALGAPSTATVTITENDPVPTAGSLQFSGAGYSVAEDGGPALITVTRTGGTFGAVSVSYSSGAGTATSGSDYTPVSGSLSFADGETSQSFDVAILDDPDYEGDETLSLTLSSPMNGATLGAPSSATVTIMDNESPPSAGSLQFSGSGYSAQENATSVRVTVSRSGGSLGEVSVEYATVDGSASSGSDYQSTSGTLTLANGEVSASADINLMDDSVVEGNETFAVELMAPTGGAVLGSPSTATVTILENDRAVASDGGGGGGGALSPMLLLLIVGWLLIAPQAGLAENDPHAKHRQMMAKTTYTVSTHTYEFDQIGVTKSDEVETSIGDLIADDKPVMVHFIFTTCTTICPVQAATFAQVQRKLGDEASEVQMISVSIDPEYDTPARLRDYAKMFQAGPQWDFITGTSEQMIQVQKSFDAYEGNKMNHRALTLIKIPGSDDWVRLEGLIGASVIIEEYRKLKSES